MRIVHFGLVFSFPLLGHGVTFLAVLPKRRIIFVIVLFALAALRRNKAAADAVEILAITAEWDTDSLVKQASAWHKNIETLRSRIDKDWDIALEVRAAPGYMLGLGVDKTWRSGGSTDGTKSDEGMVQEALNWKLEE